MNLIDFGEIEEMAESDAFQYLYHEFSNEIRFRVIIMRLTYRLSKHFSFKS